MLLFPSLACLLASVEDSLYWLVEHVVCRDEQRAAPPTIPAPRVASGWAARSTVAEPRVYLVHYQLTEAELREGRVVASYVAPCVRLFDTEELNVIWVDLVDELGPSPYRLGLEILAVEAHRLPARPANCSGA